MPKRRKGMSRRGTTRRSSGQYVPRGLAGKKAGLGQVSVNRARQVRMPKTLDSAPPPSADLSEDNQKGPSNPFGVIGDARERIK